MVASRSPRKSHQAPGPGLRPEDELILCGARLRLGPREVRHLRRLLHGDLDWDHLLKMAVRHGVIPLLHRHLKTMGPEAVPPAVLEHLQDRARQIALENAHLTGELLRILAWCEAQGIAAVPFKGSVLAAWIYGDISLRPFGDLDILIRRDDLRRAKTLLLSHGYRQAYPEAAGRELGLLRTQLNYEFVHPSHGTVVDLHCEITPKYRPTSLQPPWERLERRSLAGKPVPSLPPEDLLLILSVHGANHFWERLMWIGDLAALLEVHPTLDWDKVMDLAEGGGIGRILRLSLLLAQELLSAALPGRVEEKLRADPTLRSLAAKVRQRLWDETEAGRFKVWEDIRLDLQLRDCFRDKVQHGLHLVFTPREGDLMALRLPESLHFLH